MAVRGLYEYIDPAHPVTTALQADGYVKKAWGANIVSKGYYTDDVFKGYLMEVMQQVCHRAK